jgi:pimeloyl-ACP methyl ester carboxylesterase
MRTKIAVLALSFALAGCDLIRMQEANIVSALRSEGVRTEYADLGDARVRYYAREGRGTPILLVHGFGGSALWQWASLVPALDGRPIVFPDLLWFGGSSSHALDFSLDHQVRMVLALIDRLGYERVDVVGISYGGLVAYELASSHPDRVRRLVMVDSPGREYARSDYDVLCRELGIDHIGSLLVPDDENDVRLLLGLAYAQPPWMPDFVLWQVQDVFYGQNREEQLGMLDALLDDMEELRARPDPSAPALLIWGERDPVFPLSIARRLRARLGARLEIIHGARHAPNVESPAIFNRLVRDFLRED